MNAGVLIRKFGIDDREKVRKISCETAFLGRDRRLFIKDDELLADALTLYYTDYEPESCFVAVFENKVVGYIIGAIDAGHMEKIFFSKILFPLLLKALRQGVFFNSCNLRFFWQVILSAIRGELYAPDFSESYPAVLHINILSDFHGQSVGKRLIRCYLDYLKEKNISAVHFGTMSEGAKAFFLKTGFKILHESKRSYLKYIIGTDVPLYIFGRSLL